MDFRKTHPLHQGFSLVEVLVGLLVFAIASAATLAVFSNTIRSVFRTDDQARANAAIDSDISRLKQLSEQYNACMPPISGAVANSGSTTVCTGKWPDGIMDIKLGDSYYYYPQPGSDPKVDNTSTQFNINRRIKLLPVVAAWCP